MVVGLGLGLGDAFLVVVVNWDGFFGFGVLFGFGFGVEGTEVVGGRVSCVVVVVAGRTNSELEGVQS
jgi:hypothetical protein